MLDLHVDVLLSHSVLIHCEVLPSNVRQEVSAGVFDMKFDGHRATQRSELGLRSWCALWSFVRGGRRPARNRDLGFLLRLLRGGALALRLKVPTPHDRQSEHQKQQVGYS